VWGNLYTESQMLADRAAVVEACAKVAEQYEEGSGGHIAIRELLKGATP
jgi:hypothetical protein